MEIILVVAIVLMIIIGVLAAFTLYNVNQAGMSANTFYNFILANVKLHKLYKFTLKYEKLTREDQLLFINEAKEVFDIYDKVPTLLWEEDYNTYMVVLDRYQKLRQEAWKNKTPLSNDEFKKLIESVNEKSRKIKESGNSINNSKIKIRTIPVGSQKGHISTKFILKLAVIVIGYILLKLGKA